MKNNGVDPTRTSKKDQWSPVGSEWKSWYPLRNPGTAAPPPTDPVAMGTLLLWSRTDTVLHWKETGLLRDNGLRTVS